MVEVSDNSHIHFSMTPERVLYRSALPKGVHRRRTPQRCPSRNIHILSGFISAQSPLSHCGWCKTRSMAYTCTCVPKMAIYRIWITALPKYTTSLHKQNTSEENAGYLAGVSNCCSVSS